jgi:hypothetical protein
MRESNGLYEYIAVYVDDLLIAARDPNEIIVALSEKHKLHSKVLDHLRTNWVAIISRSRRDAMLWTKEIQYQVNR